MPRDWHPTMAFDPATGIATARGYIGHGVSTTNLAGRTLTDLITGERSPLTELPLVNHRSRNWEIEPFRWIGVRYAQWAIGRLDEQDGADRQAAVRAAASRSGSPATDAGEARRTRPVSRTAGSRAPRR